MKMHWNIVHTHNYDMLTPIWLLMYLNISPRNTAYSMKNLVRQDLGCMCLQYTPGMLAQSEHLLLWRTDQNYNWYMLMMIQNLNMFRHCSLSRNLLMMRRSRWNTYPLRSCCTTQKIGRRRQLNTCLQSNLHMMQTWMMRRNQHHTSSNHLILAQNRLLPGKADMWKCL